jgi:hypothetical protein
MHFSFPSASLVEGWKEKAHNFAMIPSFQAGPLLADVIDAETRADHVLRHPLLSAYGDAVITVARRLTSPVLVPVGTDGHRLLGAIEVRCNGELEQLGWRTTVQGRDVLLVGVVGVSSLELSAAAESARRLGARSVHACAVDAVMGDGAAVDSFTQLATQAPKLRQRRSA